jgi:hypothetical protein
LAVALTYTTMWTQLQIIQKIAELLLWWMPTQLGKQELILQTKSFQTIFSKQ